MKTFGRYLAYRLKSSALRTLVLTLISVALTQNVVADLNSYTAVNARETGIYMHAVILAILCTVIPVLETACFKNRRNIDTLYFFPIKREKLALAHYLSGFIQVVFIYSVTFLISALYLALTTDYYELVYLLPYYLLSLLLGFVMYSFFIFIFGQGNTVLDGVIFGLLWIAVVYCVAWEIRSVWIGTLYDSRGVFMVEIAEYTSTLVEWGCIYTPINNLTVIFQNLIEVNAHTNMYDYTADMAVRYKEQIYMFFLWGAVGIASVFGYFFTFVRKGAEKVGEISDSWFGYRILIPVYGVTLIHSFNMQDTVMTVLAVIAMIVGYIIYRRTFKLKLKDIIIIAACVVGAILLSAMLTPTVNATMAQVLTW